jgi:hypothetical protein
VTLSFLFTAVYWDLAADTTGVMNRSELSEERIEEPIFPLAATSTGTI